MKQYEISRLGDDLIVPTEDREWTIGYPAAAQDVAEVPRINKRYGANFYEPSWRQRFATIHAAERDLKPTAWRLRSLSHQIGSPPQGGER